ncbi:hypothetical protein QJS10_CPA02g00340 [Acorus calamus]|uniref:SWIB domain-containing protein n=1 Tax=Acorus calamus TaxID=4465 RepID=A0AAV9FB71_ACOCL|nr:hypothetical protein QJS10_CPA02g00340 [Acorus calamus]
MALSFSCFCPILLSGERLAPRTLFMAPFSVSGGRSRAAAVSCAASKPASAAATGKREPRGITKPRPISPAMQELLGVSEIPRTQALKQIWAYIKEHNLQEVLEVVISYPVAFEILEEEFEGDPDNKRVIVCDEKLKKIFAGKERVGFLEISGLINPHFMK